MYIRFRNNSGDYAVVDVKVNTKYWDDVALVHLPKELIGWNKMAWQLIDIPTGLYICSGKTKKECIEEFETRFKEQYQNFKANNPRYYRLKVELQDLIKAHEEGRKDDD